MRRRWAAIGIAAAIIAAGFAPEVSSAQQPEERDVEYAAPGGTPLLMTAFLPQDSEADRPAVVLIHGGGWQRGSRDEFAGAGRTLTREGWVAFTIDYRLDVEPGYPAEVEDVEAAVRYIRTHAEEFGVDPSRIALYGTSAGGHLAALVGVRGSGPLDEGTRVAGVVSLSGPMDLASILEQAQPQFEGPAGVSATVTEFLGCTPDECAERYDEASPITHVDESDSPMFLGNSTEEPIPAAQAETMAARLEAEGVPVELRLVPGDAHGAGLASTLRRETAAFLRGVFGEASSRPGTENPRASTTSPPVDGDEQAAREARQRDDGDDGPLLATWIALAGAAVVLAIVFITERRARKGRGQQTSPDGGSDGGT